MNVAGVINNNNNNNDLDIMINSMLDDLDNNIQKPAKKKTKKNKRSANRKNRRRRIKPIFISSVRFDSQKGILIKRFSNGKHSIIKLTHRQVRNIIRARMRRKKRLQANNNDTLNITWNDKSSFLLNNIENKYIKKSDFYEITSGDDKGIKIRLHFDEKNRLTKFHIKQQSVSNNFDYANEVQEGVPVRVIDNTKNKLNQYYQNLKNAKSLPQLFDGFINPITQLSDRHNYDPNLFLQNYFPCNYDFLDQNQNITEINYLSNLENCISCYGFNDNCGNGKFVKLIKKFNDNMVDMQNNGHINEYEAKFYTSIAKNIRYFFQKQPDNERYTEIMDDRMRRFNDSIRPIYTDILNNTFNFTQFSTQGAERFIKPILDDCFNYIQLSMIGIIAQNNNHNLNTMKLNDFVSINDPNLEEHISKQINDIINNNEPIYGDYNPPISMFNVFYHSIFRPMVAEHNNFTTNCLSVGGHNIIGRAIFSAEQGASLHINPNTYNLAWLQNILTNPQENSILSRMLKTAFLKFVKAQRYRKLDATLYHYNNVQDKTAMYNVLNDAQDNAQPPSDELICSFVDKDRRRIFINTKTKNYVVISDVSQRFELGNYVIEIEEQKEHITPMVIYRKDNKGNLQPIYFNHLTEDQKKKYINALKMNQDNNFNSRSSSINKKNLESFLEHIRARDYTQIHKIASKEKIRACTRDEQQDYNSPNVNDPRQQQNEETFIPITNNLAIIAKDDVYYYVNYTVKQRSKMVINHPDQLAIYPDLTEVQKKTTPLCRLYSDGYLELKPTKGLLPMPFNTLSNNSPSYFEQGELVEPADDPTFFIAGLIEGPQPADTNLRNQILLDNANNTLNYHKRIVLSGNLEIDKLKGDIIDPQDKKKVDHYQQCIQSLKNNVAIMTGRDNYKQICLADLDGKNASCNVTNDLYSVANKNISNSREKLMNEHDYYNHIEKKKKNGIMTY